MDDSPGAAPLWGSGALGRDGTQSCSQLYHPIKWFLLRARVESVLGRYSKSESGASLRRGAASGRCTAGLGDRSGKCHVSGTQRSSVPLFIAGDVSGSGQRRRVLDADISVIVLNTKVKYTSCYYGRAALPARTAGPLSVEWVLWKPASLVSSRTPPATCCQVSC